MDKAEQMRNEFVAELNTCGIEQEQMTRIIECFDRIATNYSINRQNTDLIVRTNVLPQSVKEYIASKVLEGRSKNTAEYYLLVLTKFFEYIRKTPEETTTNDIRSFLYWCMNRDNGVSPQTADAYRGVVKYYFAWMIENGYLDRNPCTAIKTIKHEKTHKKAMTRVDLIQIQDVCRTPREKALIDFFYSTGCRISEVASVKKSDVNFGTRQVMVFGKGAKHRVTWLNDRSVITLRKYLESRSDCSSYLFVSDRKPHQGMTTAGIRKVISDIVSRIQDGTSVKVTPHIFRHTSATLALENGMPVTQVQKFLGHESIGTTMQYVDINQTDVSNAHGKYVV